METAQTWLGRVDNSWNLTAGRLRRRSIADSDFRTDFHPEADANFNSNAHPGADAHSNAVYSGTGRGPVGRDIRHAQPSTGRGESLDDLAALAEIGGEATEEVIKQLCDVAAGEYEPYLALENLVDGFVVQTAIRGFCAAR